MCVCVHTCGCVGVWVCGCVGVWVCYHYMKMAWGLLNLTTAVPPGVQAGEEPGKRTRCVQHGVPEECGPEGMEQHPGYT